MSSKLKFTSNTNMLAPDEAKPTREESNMMFQLEGDYARGLRTLTVEFEGADYARGLRTLPAEFEGADYASGLRTQPYTAEGPDYARGLRTVAGSTGAVVEPGRRQGLNRAGATVAGK